MYQFLGILANNFGMSGYSFFLHICMYLDLALVQSFATLMALLEEKVLPIVIKCEKKPMSFENKRLVKTNITQRNGNSDQSFC